MIVIQITVARRILDVYSSTAEPKLLLISRVSLDVKCQNVSSVVRNYCRAQRKIWPLMAFVAVKSNKVGSIFVTASSCAIKLNDVLRKRWSSCHGNEVSVARSFILLKIFKANRSCVAQANTKP